MRKGYQGFLAAGLLGTGLILANVQNAAAEGTPEKYTKTDFVMDTVLTEAVYTTGEDPTSEIADILRDTEENCISWTKKDSDVSRINECSGEETQTTEKTAEYLKKILKLAEDTNGAFDPTMGKIIRLWDVSGENPHVPEKESILELLENTGFEKISLQGKNVRLEKGTTLDLGAVGKGIGCDEAAEFLKMQKDVAGAIVTLGGSSVMTYGQKPDGSDWQVAVTDPRDTQGDYLGVISLSGTEFLSTSGDYEKFFIEDGIRYHHIMDPATGYPVQNGLTSVTVVCDSGLYADGLSTACFVLGMENSLSVLKEYDAEALFVYEDHSVYATEGMQERFQYLKDGYEMKTEEIHGK